MRLQPSSKETSHINPRNIESLKEFLLYLYKTYSFIPKQIVDSDNQYEEIKKIEYCYWNVMEFTVVTKDCDIHRIYLSENDIYAIESGFFSFLMSKNMIDFDEIDTRSFFFNEEIPIKIDDRQFDYPEVKNQEPEFWAMYMAFQDPQERFDVLKRVLKL